jgi:UDP-GlcNAc:undecaprenyl-phosphate GlcNAc-1-phosphate transferase
MAVLAYGVSVVLTPVVRWIAYRTNIVDRPDQLLKPHGRPVAYLGGLAVCVGFVTAVIVGMHKQPALWPLAGAILLASAVITLTGLLDDLKDLRPKYKVLGQVVAAAILFAGLCSAGIHVSAARMFFVPLGIKPPVWAAVPFSALLTLVVVVAACNATNLLDGLDGLCGGVTGIISLAFVALAVYLACSAGPDAPYHEYEFRVILCLAMAGAVLGFLPYNAPPASIFLGDAGSMLLGFFVATMVMLFALEGTLRWFLAAGVVFGLPIMDTGLAVVRRVLKGVSIFTGDRSHLYDQLVDRGMSIKQVVGLFYARALVAAALGLLQSLFLRGRYALLLDLGVLAAIGLVFAAKGMIRANRKTLSESSSPQTPPS